MIYGDWETYFLDNEERLYRFAVFKRMFTPYEQDKKYSDESLFESTIWRFGYIREVIPLPDGDILLGIEEVFDEVSNGTISCLDFYKLSELRLAYNKEDVMMFISEDEDEQ